MLSASEVSSKIKWILHLNGNKAVTFRWEQFYALANRAQFHQPFLDDVEIELKQHDILIVYGNNAVIVVRDFCWSPVDL